MPDLDALVSGRWRATLSTGIEGILSLDVEGDRWTLRVWKQARPTPMLSGGGRLSERDGWYVVALAFGALPFPAAAKD